jgi:hypothetical protein
MSEQDQNAAPVMKDADYFLAHADEYNALTAEEVAALSNNGHLGEVVVVEETATAAVEDKAKADAAAEEAANAAAAIAAEEKAKVNEPAKTGADDGKPTGILSKDGNHVIPYTRLEESQAEATRLKQLTETQAQLIATLTVAKEADDVTGGTQAQEDVLAQLNEDFPELAEKLGPVLKVMIEQGVKTTVGALEAKVNELIKPLQSSVEESAADKHFNAIRDVHGDFDELMKSDVVDKWIETQPSLMQDRYKEVLEKGTAKQVVELLSIYKDATKVETTADVTKADAGKTLSKEEIAAAAKEAVEKAKVGKDAPKSMSDIPAGSVQVTDELSAMMDMSETSLLAKMAGKTPAQIEQLMQKMI